MNQKQLMGRPSKYSPELAEYICSQIANGMSLRQVCADDAMPDKKTVMRWLAAHTEFCHQYAYAREMQQEYFCSRIIEIADSVPPKRKAIQKARLQIDALKWTMARMLPKKYGNSA
ncbi:hypothetical protein [Conchiformibius steedae]|uniref:terminase small subunit-like protein n=1 Tax=Conchiformibius steedae TaxID=153493 RepID=UPI0026E955DE|nr:hypothetical protein [Conchiformibius steedae]